MEAIIISISGDRKKEDIYEILSREESGFEVDFSTAPPLNSGVEVALAIAGVILNVAQLATTLWQIRHPNAGTQSPIVVEAQREDGVPILLAGSTPDEIATELESIGRLHTSG